MKTKTIYLLLALILILILIIIIKSQTSNKPDQIQPVVQFNTAVPTSTSQETGFEIVSTSINDQIMSINGSITVMFNKPVSSNLILTIQPETKVEINPGANPNEFIINPVDTWAFSSTYTLTISNETLSFNNEPLNKNYVYTFKTPTYTGI